jgi:hypothetical protein
LHFESGMNDPLRSQIRDKMSSGDLPRENCVVTLYAAGRGEHCAACGQRILGSETAVECDLPRAGVLRFHRRCYDLWQLELAA